MKKVIYLILFVFISDYSFAADPPRLADYKAKIEMWIENSCDDGCDYGDPGCDFVTDVRDMWLTRPSSLNLSPVYYDASKVMFELSELYGSNDIGGYDITTCRSESIDVFNDRYEDGYPNTSGFTRFPHGLAYNIISYNDAATISAFEKIRDGSNWDDNYIPLHNQIIYSRENAYALQVYVRAQMIGLPHADQANILSWYLELVLGQINQWSSGDFYPPIETNDYMQTFMAGLSMAALIEYYEYIDQDTRIPPAIKSLLDIMWAQAWWPDIHNPPPSSVGDACDYFTSYPDGGGYGAFWYWLDWNEANQNYDFVPNKLPSSCDVNADTNMLSGNAYAWYSMVSGETSGTDPYMSRAVDIWEGSIQNAYFGDARHVWEASRYNHDFIRYYRKVTGSICEAGTVEMCEDEVSCEGIGANWTGYVCQNAPVYSSDISPIVNLSDYSTATTPTSFPGTTQAQVGTIATIVSNNGNVTIDSGAGTSNVAFTVSGVNLVSGVNVVEVTVTDSEGNVTVEPINITLTQTTTGKTISSSTFNSVRIY